MNKFTVNQTSDQFKVIFWLSTFIVMILIGLMCYNQIQIQNLEERIDNLKKEQVYKIVEMNQDVVLNKLEFDSFKKLTNDEFERTWVSFGRIRNNFIALGTGMHLVKEDFDDR